MPIGGGGGYLKLSCVFLAKVYRGWFNCNAEPFLQLVILLSSGACMESFSKLQVYILRNHTVREKFIPALLHFLHKSTPKLTSFCD